MSTTPSPRGEATDLDPRLSYLLSSQHHSVSRLLNLSLTEIIHPAPPKLPNIPTTNSTTSLSTDQDLAVKDSQDFVVKDSLVAHEPRCLLTSTSCSCLPAQQFKQTNGPIAGWDRNESVPLSHFVASVKSPSEPTKNGSSLPKSSSTGKIETSRVFRGYPYEKTDIPFHFQHLDEDDPAADYAEMYRVAFTYPNLEDKLRSSSISDYTSYSAPSVIEPKLLMFGVSKPGVAKPHRPAYIKQSYKFYTTPQHHQSSKKTQEPSTAQLHQAFSSLPTKSTPILEVYHGQASTNHHLPNPTSPDSPPTTIKTSHKHPGPDNQTNPYHFQDLVNIDDTHPVKGQKRPSVKWASHRFPMNLVPSANQDAVKQVTSSSKQRQQHVCNAQARKLRAASFPRARNTQVHLGSDVPSPYGLLDLSAASFSKIPPKSKGSSMKPQQNENRGLKGQREGMSHAISYDHLAHAQGLGKNRSKHQTTSVHLMPTSKALVPTLGIYSRTTLAQRSMDFL